MRDYGAVVGSQEQEVGCSEFGCGGLLYDGDGLGNLRELSESKLLVGGEETREVWLAQEGVAHGGNVEIGERIAAVHGSWS